MSLFTKVSHTGKAATVGGQGCVHARASKQKLNTKSSTEGELVGVWEGLPELLWTRNIVKAQGYQHEPITLAQDNQSTIALIKKGRSTSQRTRHIALRYFFVKDYVDKEIVRVVYVPTDEMVADILTKPVHGTPVFRKLRKMLLGRDYLSYLLHQFL